MNKAVLLMLIAYSPSCFSQLLEPQPICLLPEEISEASGLEIAAGGLYWTLNDSGNPPVIYAIDKNGSIQRKLAIKNAQNKDFEELCKDVEGFVYIGDFGNNLNDRQDLTILKVNPQNASNADSLIAEKIRFSFPDQTAFPPPHGQLNFDCEAMFHFKNQLYLFSKNRDSGYTRLYRLPDSAGTYTAELLDSFNTGGWITAADISPNQELVALLSEDYLWLFYNFMDDGFFNGEAVKITFTKSQKEALVFDTDQSVVIADERENQGSPGQVYRIDFADLLRDLFSKTRTDPVVMPNPLSAEGLLSLPISIPGEVELTLFDPHGNVVKKTSFDSASRLPLYCEELSPGVYFFEVLDALGDRWTGSFVVAR